MSSIERVWYASYGSNLSADRFAYYLSGGAMAGHTRGHAGARDATPAAADRVWRIPHALLFGGESVRWNGGGVAFVDPSPGSGEAVVRMWNLTPAQFDDVAAQENRLDPGSLAIDHAEVRDAGHLDVTDRWYGRVLWCGDVDDTPVFTFTRSQRDDTNAPGEAYLSVVGRGLIECGVSLDRAVDYLLDAHGVSDAWSASEIRELLLSS